MRTAIVAIPLLLLAAACNVSKDDGNGTTTVSFDQNQAEETLGTVSNQAQTVGGEIVNDVKEAGDTVQDKAGNVDIDVDTNTADGNAN
jgi:hypothetical protein